jgi:hypothetical protein
MLGILLKIGIGLSVKPRHASGLRMAIAMHTCSAAIRIDSPCFKPGRVIKHVEN